MTNALHIPARPGAPIACDMSTASDTPEERLAAYRATVRARAAAARAARRRGRVRVPRRRRTRAAVEDLARREAACCPFLDYRVEAARRRGDLDDQQPDHRDERASVDVVLDAFYALPAPG